LFAFRGVVSVFSNDLHRAQPLACGGVDAEFGQNFLGVLSQRCCASPYLGGCAGEFRCWPSYRSIFAIFLLNVLKHVTLANLRVDCSLMVGTNASGGNTCAVEAFDCFSDIPALQPCPKQPVTVLPMLQAHGCRGEARIVS